MKARVNNPPWSNKRRLTPLPHLKAVCPNCGRSITMFHNGKLKTHRCVAAEAK